MKAVLLFRQRMALRKGTFKEISVWILPRRLSGSNHPYKYRMALVDAGVCVLRYDNEAGKGDQRHMGSREEPYAFTTIERLCDDFETSVRTYLDGHPDHR
ncbi:MAG: toxin-antitoxin system TumE family protein [Acetobacteraceae bacterium]